MHHTNGMEGGKNPINIIISIDAEKAFNKNQHLSMIKTLIELDLEENFLNMKKAIYKHPQLATYPMIKD